MEIKSSSPTYEFFRKPIDSTCSGTSLLKTRHFLPAKCSALPQMNWQRSKVVAGYAHVCNQLIARF